MSLYLNFEPHSWYKHFAIKDNRLDDVEDYRWSAYTDDGNTYRIIRLDANTLKELHDKITSYREKE